MRIGIYAYPFSHGKMMITHSKPRLYIQRACQFFPPQEEPKAVIEVCVFLNHADLGSLKVTIK